MYKLAPFGNNETCVPSVCTVHSATPDSDPIWFFEKSSILSSPWLFMEMERNQDFHRVCILKNCPSSQRILRCPTLFKVTHWTSFLSHLLSLDSGAGARPALWWFHSGLPAPQKALAPDFQRLVAKLLHKDFLLAKTIYSSLQNLAIFLRNQLTSIFKFRQISRIWRRILLTGNAG